MGNYIYYGYTSVRRTVTLEPAVKKVDTATLVKEVSQPNCEITTLEKVTVNTAPIIKEEAKSEEQKNVEEKEVEEEKEESKKEIKESKMEVKEIKEIKTEVKEVKEPKNEVKVKEEPKKEINEKIVINLKSVMKEKAKSPLLTPIEEESMNIHPYLLEYGTEPFKSDILLIQNEFYQPNKKKNKKKKNQPNVFSEE
jgi:hypothetical protein